MFERFSDHARRAVVLAQEEARLLEHDWIGSEHVFLGLFRVDGSEAATVLAASGLGIEAARAEVLAVVGRTRIGGGHIPFTPDAKAALERSLRAALSLGDRNIRTGHLLLGILERPGPILDRVLDALEVDRADLAATVTRHGREHPERVEERPDAPTAGDWRAAEVAARRRAWRGQGWAGVPVGAPPMPFGGIGGPGLALVRCVLCGRRAGESGPLVAGPTGVAVCQRCVLDAERLLGAPRAVPEGEEAPRLWLFDPDQIRAVPGLSEADARAAVDEIGERIAHLADLSDDGLDAVSVERGRGLGPFIAEAGARYGGAEPARFEVHRVELTTADRAVASFTVHVPDGTSVGQTGEAVRVAGEWKVTRDTLTRMLAMAGVQCPPAEPEPGDDPPVA